MNTYRPAMRALTAFEAAARHNSFNGAAAELNVTPSAISHQIIELEKKLGVELFLRVGRGVELTKFGQKYLKDIDKVLKILDSATKEIIEFGDENIVSMYMPPSIAAKWAMPLLADFMACHSHIDVQVSAEPGKSWLGWDFFDLAIFYTKVDDNDSRSFPLIAECIQPLCNARLLQDFPIKQAEDLLSAPLIQSKYNAITWNEWFGYNNILFSKDKKIFKLDPSHLAIEAAVSGLGFILESNVLASNEISSGVLQSPLPKHSIKRTSYVLSWPASKRRRTSVETLKQWLILAAKSHAYLP